MQLITLRLTFPQARALLKCAEEGASGLLTDPAACEAYVGTPSQVRACRRGLKILREAVYSNDRPRTPRRRSR